MGSRARERAGALAAVVLSAVGLLLVAGFLVQSSRAAPRNALLYLDAATGEYLSPPCLSDGVVPDNALEDPRYRRVRRWELPRGAHPNAECRDDDGFLQPGRSLTGTLLERVGMLDTLPSRWNADGTWRW